MKHVVVLTTGGTISTRDVDGSGARPVLRGQDLLQQIPDLGAVAEGEGAELAFVPGAFMTLATMRQMNERARQIPSPPPVAGAGGAAGPRSGGRVVWSRPALLPASSPASLLAAPFGPGGGSDPSGWGWR